MDKTHKTKLILLIFFLFVSVDAAAYEIMPAEPLFILKKDFLQPSDVTVGKDGNIYVLDGVNHCVKVFDKKGKYIFAFGSKGEKEGELKSPLGIASDKNGNIYIADSGNHRAQIFNSKGLHLRTLSLPARGTLHTPDPVDLDVDEKRKRLYVVDNDNHRIVVYSLKDKTPVTTWGSEGVGYGQFRYPFFISVGYDTSVYITDVLNTRVAMWSPAGKHLRSLGEWGVDVGQFFRPKGVCSDKNNLIYVSDSYLGVIQVFNRYGHLKYILGDSSGKILKWKSPVGIAIDDDLRLYIVEMMADQVSVYQLKEK